MKRLPLAAPRDKTKRLLLNIAGNAVKYNRRGGYVRLVCREVEPADGIPVYEYTIADNGIGMSEEFQQHLYGRGRA